MKIIVGLGNPGREYEQTRHNLGFMVVHELSRRLELPLTHSSMHAEWGRGRYEDQPILLARPTTYMNASGMAVAALIRYFKIPIEQCIVIIDDMNLPLGKMRFRSRGSAGGHNGLKSIIEKTGSQDFPRLRLGINNPDPHLAVTDFVLGKFNREERSLVDPMLPKAADALLCWASKGIESTMREYN